MFVLFRCVCCCVCVCVCLGAKSDPNPRDTNIMCLQHFLTKHPTMNVSMEDNNYSPTTLVANLSVVVTRVATAAGSVPPAAPAVGPAQASQPSPDNLRAYLMFNFVNFNAKAARRIFGIAHGHGRIATPNWGARGASRNYSETIEDLRKYFRMSIAEQNEVNNKYRIDTSSAVRRQHKANYCYLNSDEAKADAISNHPSGEEIATSVRYGEETSKYNHAMLVRMTYGYVSSY